MRALSKIQSLVTKRIFTTLTFVLAVGFTTQGAKAQILAVDLNSAWSFAVIAGSTITVAGPTNSTVITGDIGTYPGTSITGLENVILNGVNHGSNSITQQAQIDLQDAYDDAATRPNTTLFPAIHDIGGLTLLPGVYKAPSSLAITGVLTLDAAGDANAVWIFQMVSTLTTAMGSNVILINGAQTENIFWQVGSSATLGVNSNFQGSILASESITLTTDAVITGRALALNAAVTMDNNIVTIPETNSVTLIALGMAFSALSRRRKTCSA